MLIRAETCAICRAYLHIIDRELPSPKLLLIPGYQIVGTIEHPGKRVTRWTVGFSSSPSHAGSLLAGLLHPVDGAINDGVSNSNRVSKANDSNRVSGAGGDNRVRACYGRFGSARVS